MIIEPERSGETISDVCIAFGVSRATWYKWKMRYDTYGLDGLKSSQWPIRLVLGGAWAQTVATAYVPIGTDDDEGIAPLLAPALTTLSRAIVSLGLPFSQSRITEALT